MAPAKRPPRRDLGLTPATFREYVRFTGGNTVMGHFKKLDVNHDGEMTKKEFREAARLMGFLEATNDECDGVFAWLDHDGSGTIPCIMPPTERAPAL